MIKRILVVVALLSAVALLVPVSAQNPIQVFFGAIPWVAGNGTTTTGTARVTLASDSTGQVKATNFPATADTNNGTTGASTLRVTVSSDSTGQIKATNFPTTVDVNVGAAGVSTLRVIPANDTDPCRSQANTKSYASVNQTATTQILGLAGAAKKYYVCSIHLVTATAQNVAVIDSTTAGNACATSPSGSDGFGGSTAATGWNFAANGGIAYGEGGFTVGVSHNANAALCIAQSGAGQLSGGFSYVIQ